MMDDLLYKVLAVVFGLCPIALMASALFISG
ncbi:hypothetical protein ABIE91_000592 [Bradyrhizobium elkanii]